MTRAEDAADQGLRPACPARHLQSAYMRARATHQLASRLDREDNQTKARILSAGGPTAGTCFVASMAGAAVLNFTGQAWMAAIRWRWGMVAGPADIRCQNWNKSKEEPCGETLDIDGDHAVGCPCGPLRNMRHNAICDCWADFVDEVGGAARRGCYSSIHSTASQEAWLDVQALGIPELGSCLFDVTVRNPRCPRHRQAAADRAGATADRAEADKATRYPQTLPGKKVVTLSQELWGRLGDSAEHVLQLLAAVGARRDHRAGIPPANRLRRWRAILDATLHKAVAAQLESSWQGLTGRPHRRKPQAVRPANLQVCSSQSAGAP